MSLTLKDMVFAFLAGLTVLAALGVVFSRNIIHSALFLVLSFLGVAGIYFQLNAEFLGLVQILVYGGAISVLMIFAIMLVMKTEPARSNPPNPNRIPRVLGTCVTGLLTVILAASIWTSRFSPCQDQPAEETMEQLAGLIMGDYVIAFEAAAVLLLVAVMGAIILAKGAEGK